eukprot:TRINITY_DN4733_c1_g1_i11.p1 TRINITY_DN4733_c1_g1~~TRINITY_DN4733_c1_g1_i11.p1  ORF type:complete len:368 (-),score=66.44 TRINITY_DN4733_c1_g1_i11:388-1491(-)
MIGGLIRSLSSSQRYQILTIYEANKFHTSGPRRKLPLILFTLIKPLAKITSYVLGRGTRKAWKKLPTTQQRTYLEMLNANRGAFMCTGAFSLGGLYYLYESHKQTCPITGRQKFVALTPDQARRIGEANFTEIVNDAQGIIVPETDPVYTKIAKVANGILHANSDLRQIYDKTWTLTVIDAPVMNAFVLPSGNIFVFTGLLENCSNMDQVAAVLSHEIAHVVLGHVEEKLTRTSFLQMLLLVPMSLLWVLIPYDGIGFVTTWFFDSVADIMLELPFSRLMEVEADEVGLVLAAKACFDIREAPKFWGRMAQEEEAFSEELEFLSTHPASQNRQDNLQEKMASALQIRQDCGCPPLDYPAPRSSNSQS